jgi:hypothetical protein
MKKRQPPAKTIRAPQPLRSAKVGFRVLVFYDSILELLGIDPASEPPERPKTVTIKRAEELTGLCERTIYRMIAEGRAAPAPDNQTAA